MKTDVAVAATASGQLNPLSEPVANNTSSHSDRERWDSILADDPEKEDDTRSAYEELESITDTQEQRLAKYVLAKQPLDAATLTRTAVRSTLRRLAGTKELQDPAILERY